LLGVALLVPPATAAGPAGAGSTVPPSGLTVTSDPAGAAVYVDGALAGQTPLMLANVAAGDHRVRVVKNGYLENARVVSVSSSKPSTVDIHLTRELASASSSAVSQVTNPNNGGGGGGGGGHKKWLWIGLAGGGAAAATAVAVANKNHPPEAGTISVSPNGTGMAGQTSFAFSSQASDPDGDGLTYNWNFGDGSTSQAASPTKTYQTPGTYNVTLTVSDGKKDASAPGASVRIGQNLTANWTGGREGQFGCAINVALTQNGGNLTGTMTFAGGCTGTLAGITGTTSPLTHPSTVNWVSPAYQFTSGTSVFPNLVMSFTGTTNADGTSMTGNLRLRQTSSAFDQLYPATYTR
jgi:hypothetical protein